MTVVYVLIALVMGLVVGGAAVWLVKSRWDAEDAAPQVEPSEPVIVAPQVVEVVQLLRSAAMVIGPHDEVVCSNGQARTLGLCRGDRILMPQVLELVRKVRRQGRGEVVDMVVTRGKGAPALHLNSRVSLLDDGVELVLTEDRTPLVRVDETRRDFVANIGHELKTPIGAITLLAEAVDQAADDPDAIRHFAGRMGKESARLAELVTQIIDLSRLQADDPMLRAEPLAVDDLVAQAIDRSHELAERRQVNVLVTGAKGLKVNGEANQLTDAISNLVQNALVYSHEKARVVVQVDRVDEDGLGMVEIAVADNGIGISPENQQRIFERFYRVDYARSRENGGTGLGLSIVKHIAAVHGGSVNVWSKLGQGSTFTLRLPELTADEIPVGAPNSTTERL